jgi:hypothetical protein
MTYFDVHDTKQPLISKIRRLINHLHHTKVYTDSKKKDEITDLACECLSCEPHT